MIKKIALPLLMAGTVFGITSTASALAYVGVGVGVAITGQDHGYMDITDSNGNLTDILHIKTKAGNVSATLFGGLSVLPFLSIEGDLDYTQATNKTARETAWEQAVFGDKEVKTSIISPFVNVVLRTASFQGASLFAFAGPGMSYTQTNVEHINPEYQLAGIDMHGNEVGLDPEYDPDLDVSGGDSETDADGNKSTITQKFSKISFAYNAGVGLSYDIPNSMVTVSGGYRFVNLGKSSKNYHLKATSKQEVFLRAQFGF